MDSCGDGHLWENIQVYTMLSETSSMIGSIETHVDTVVEDDMEKDIMHQMADSVSQSVMVSATWSANSLLVCRTPDGPLCDCPGRKVGVSRIRS